MILRDPVHGLISFEGATEEIVTAVQEGRKITIVLNDNRAFGCIHNLQRGQGGRSFGNEFRARSRSSGRLEGAFVEVDFAANARSLGATAITANLREFRRVPALVAQNWLSAP